MKLLMNDVLMDRKYCLYEDLNALVRLYIWWHRRLRRCRR